MAKNSVYLIFVRTEYIDGEIIPLPDKFHDETTFDFSLDEFYNCDCHDEEGNTLPIEGITSEILPVGIFDTMNKAERALKYYGVNMIIREKDIAISEAIPEIVDAHDNRTVTCYHIKKVKMNDLLDWYKEWAMPTVSGHNMDILHDIDDAFDDAIENKEEIERSISIHKNDDFDNMN